MALYTDGAEIAIDVGILTTTEIQDAVTSIKFGRADRRSRPHLMETISQLPVHAQDQIRVTAAKKRSDSSVSTMNDRVSKQTKITHIQGQGHEDISVSSPDTDDASSWDNNDFMKPQSQDIVERCISKFIDATGNAAVASAVCVACAREVALAQTDSMLISAIPHGYLLSPSEPHHAHVLSTGMLLYLPAVTPTTEGARGSVCGDCLTSLKRARLPPLSLANDMWIGDVPFELSVLTLPERVLIARNFQAAHIVKLFPQIKGARSTNRALRGNVSSYRINTDEIADMVQGNTMPNPSAILASTIGVTIIGPNNLCEKTMPGFLWVRRERVREALVWLRANNPLYKDIDISAERLLDLNENGVPDEILGGMRRSDDIEELERERAGYVPEDDDIVTGGGNNEGDVGGGHWLLHKNFACAYLAYH
jgi:hypothetical protein